jgi:hypothetical protein
MSKSPCSPFYRNQIKDWRLSFNASDFFVRNFHNTPALQHLCNKFPLFLVDMRDSTLTVCQHRVISLFYCTCIRLSCLLLHKVVYIF